MKLIREVRRIGDAAPTPGAKVTVQTWPAGVLVCTAETDAEGLATCEAQGTPGPVRIRTDRGGSLYDEYSANISPVSQFDLANLSTRLDALVADGILPRVGDQFRATLGTGSITLAGGGVIISGIWAIFPSSTTLTVSAGDRAAVARLAAGAITLVDIDYASITAGDAPLWRYTVSSGGAISALTDIGRMAGNRAQRKAQIGIARLAAGTTLNAAGEASELTTTLQLESGTYDIRARVVAHGKGRDGALALDLGAGVGTYRSLNGDVAGRLSNADSRSAVAGPATVVVTAYERRDTVLTASQWAIQATYGPIFDSIAMSNPGQIAISSTGLVCIADTGNNRFVRLLADGTFSSFILLTVITGVCIDASDNVYVYYQNATSARLTKYNSFLAAQWTQSVGTKGGQAHITTDGTHVWACNTTDRKVYKRLCSTGAAVSSFGSAGTGNGQFGSGGPFGIVVDATYLYVSDPSFTRVQQFVKATSAYDSLPLSGDPSFDMRGLALDSSGSVVVCFRGYPGPGGNGVVTHMDDLISFYSVGCMGVGVATGDVLWVGSSTANTIAKWDEAVSNLPFEYEAALLTAIAIPR